MISLTLPYPPTTNNLFLNVGKRRIRSPGYRDWIALAFCEVLRAGPSARRVVIGPYHMTLTADRPDKRRRDLSNLLKPTEDLLTYAAVIRDDSDAKEITLRWSDRPVGKGAQVHVTVTPC